MMWPIDELPPTDPWIARKLQDRRDIEAAAQLRKDREEDAPDAAKDALIMELRAEIERLKAELRVAYQLPSAVEHAADAELRAEIERLRAALKPMVEHFNVGGGKVPIGKMLEDACKALEGK